MTGEPATTLCPRVPDLIFHFPPVERYASFVAPFSGKARPSLRGCPDPNGFPEHGRDVFGPTGSVIVGASTSAARCLFAKQKPLFSGPTAWGKLTRLSRFSPVSLGGCGRRQPERSVPRVVTAERSNL